MNIVYASDNNFAEMLGISMISLFENNKHYDKITVYVLDNGIDDENKEKLYSISEKYNREISFIDTRNTLNKDMKQQRGSLSTFSRLYIEYLLPQNIEKVLYLDCDILVLDSLSPFYETDIEKYYCAGVRDCLSIDHLKALGLKNTDAYINAGVLLINMDMWRKEKISTKFEDFAQKFNNDVPYADQGILNGVISGKVAVADLKYDSYTLIYDFTYKNMLRLRKPVNFYSEAQVEAARKAPVIVHFTSTFTSLRPWIEDSTHPYTKEWLRYKAMTPWADVSLRKDNRSSKKKIAVAIYKMLPSTLAVSIAGLLHAKIMPAIKKKIKQ